MRTERPRRVLHVLRRMDRGGVETWLMHLLRRVDPARLRMDFFVNTCESSAYDGEILDRGARLHRCADDPWSPGYAFALSRALEGAAYDVVHSHLHHFSGYVVALAGRCGVPSRIAHSHSDTSRADRAANPVRRAYLRLATRWIRKDATRMVGVSRAAAESLFGAGWDSDVRSAVLHCGIDLEPFRCLPSRREAKARLGFAETDLVIGHVGRLAAPKNHAFLIRVAAEIRKSEPSARLLLVGDGPLRADIEERIRDAGLASGSVFAGSRDDVPELLAAMDVFVFPSLWEGLPLSVVEAQAAGLPCVVADHITPEAEIVASSVVRVSPGASPGQWARAALDACHREIARRTDALRAAEKSGFNIGRSLGQLYAIYGA